jgi:hypothetical protein
MSMTLEVVALIDDNQTDLQKWQEQFERVGIRAHGFTERETFARSLARGDHYDAIILDWFFEDESSSVIAQLILEEDIRLNRYVPVFIYTNESDTAETEKQGLTPPFNRIVILSKEDFTAAALTAEIKRWYANSTGARLAQTWRDARSKAFEQSLYELEAVEGESLQRSLQHVLILDSGPTSDIEHAMDFLERFVARKVLTNTELREALRVELTNARKQPGFRLRGDREKALINTHRYIPLPKDNDCVETGDFVEIVSGSDPGVSQYAIVITPACDLENRKCVELRLVLAERTELAKEHSGSEVVLTALRSSPNDAFRNYLLNFHRTLFLIDRVFSDNPLERQDRAIAYSHDFVDTFGQQFKLDPICRLDDPYRADLLQKFSSHAARIGIP